MDWKEALEIVVKFTRHEVYREKCGDSHPDREKWRARMVEKAMGLRGEVSSPTPGVVVTANEGGSVSVSYPSVAQQAMNFAGAVARTTSAAVHRRPVTVSAEVYAERLAICQGCENFDKNSMIPRCRICGCSTQAKLSLAPESCPLPVPKWTAVESK